MSYEWIAEHPAYWDEDKKRIIGHAETGVFDTRFSTLDEGALLPNEWWRVVEDGKVVGYGWLDAVWGDAEILLATDKEAQGQGVGAFILESLETEAQKRGLNYLYNMVRPTHPEGDKVAAWLQKRGFKASEDGRLLRASSRKQA